MADEKKGLKPEQVIEQVKKVEQRMDLGKAVKGNKYFRNLGGSVMYMADEFITANTPSLKTGFSAIKEFKKDASKLFREGKLMEQVADRKSKASGSTRSFFSNIADDIKSGDIAGSKRLKALEKSMEPDDDWDLDDESWDNDYEDDTTDDGSDLTSDSFDNDRSAPTTVKNLVNNNITAPSGNDEVVTALRVHSDANESIQMRSEVFDERRHNEAMQQSRLQTQFLSDIATIQKGSVDQAASALRSSLEGLEPKLTDAIALFKEVSHNTKRTNAIAIWKETKDTDDYVEKTDFEESFEDTTGYDINGLKGRIKNAVGDSEVANMYNLLTDDSFGPSFVQRLVTAPLGTILPMMIPSTVSSMAETLESVISGAVPRMIMNASEYGKTKGGFVGQLTSLLGYESMDLSSVGLGVDNKEVVWNFDSDRALKEVIPDLLAMILAKMDGSPQLTYDYRKGKYTTVDLAKEKYDAAKNDSFKSAMALDALSASFNIDSDVAARYGVDMNSSESRDIIKHGLGNISRKALNLGSVRSKVNSGDEDFIGKLMENYGDSDEEKLDAATKFSNIVGLLNADQYNTWATSIFSGRTRAKKRHDNLKNDLLDNSMSHIYAMDDLEKTANHSTVKDGVAIDKSDIAALDTKRLFNTSGSIGTDVASILREGILVYQMTDRAFGKKLKKRASIKMIDSLTAAPTPEEKQTEIVQEIADSVSNIETHNDDSSPRAGVIRAVKDSREYFADIGKNIVDGFSKSGETDTRKLSTRIKDGMSNALNLGGNPNGIHSTNDIVEEGEKKNIFKRAVSNIKDTFSNIKEKRKKPDGPEIPHMDTGGVVPGYGGKDNVTVKLAGKEVVLNHEDIIKLGDMLNIDSNATSVNDQLDEVTVSLMEKLKGPTAKTGKLKPGLFSVGDKFTTKDPYLYESTRRRKSIAETGKGMVKGIGYGAYDLGVGTLNTGKNIVVGTGKGVGRATTRITEAPRAKSRLSAYNAGLRNDYLNKSERAVYENTVRSNNKYIGTRSRKTIPFANIPEPPVYTVAEDPNKKATKGFAGLQNKVNSKLNKTLDYFTSIQEAGRSGKTELKNKIVADAGNVGKAVKGKFNKIKDSAKSAALDYGQAFQQDGFKGVLGSMLYGMKDEEGNKVRKGIYDQILTGAKKAGTQMKSVWKNFFVGEKQTTTDKNGVEQVGYEGGILSPVMTLGYDAKKFLKDKFLGDDGIIAKMSGKALDLTDKLFGVEGKTDDKLSIGDQIRFKLFGGKDDKFGGLFGGIKRNAMFMSKRFFGEVFGYKDLNGDGKRAGGLSQFIWNDMIKASGKDIKDHLFGDRFNKKDELVSERLDSDKTGLSIRGVAERFKNNNKSVGVTAKYMTTNLKSALMDNLVTPAKMIQREFKTFAEASLTEVKSLAKNILLSARHMTMDLMGKVLKGAGKMMFASPLGKVLRVASSGVQKATGLAGGGMRHVAKGMGRFAVKVGTKSFEDQLLDETNDRFDFSNKKKQLRETKDGLKDKLADISHKGLSREEKQRLKELKAVSSTYTKRREVERMSSKDRREYNRGAKRRSKNKNTQLTKISKGYTQYKEMMHDSGMKDDVLDLKTWATGGSNKVRDRYDDYANDALKNGGKATKFEEWVKQDDEYNTFKATQNKIGNKLSKGLSEEDKIKKQMLFNNDKRMSKNSKFWDEEYINTTYTDDQLRDKEKRAKINKDINGELDAYADKSEAQGLDDKKMSIAQGTLDEGVKQTSWLERIWERLNSKRSTEVVEEEPPKVLSINEEGPLLSGQTRDLPNEPLVLTPKKIESIVEEDDTPDTSSKGIPFISSMTKNIIGPSEKINTETGTLVADSVGEIGSASRRNATELAEETKEIQDNKDNVMMSAVKNIAGNIEDGFGPKGFLRGVKGFFSGIGSVLKTVGKFFPLIAGGLAAVPIVMKFMPVIKKFLGFDVDNGDDIVDGKMDFNGDGLGDQELGLTNFMGMDTGGRLRRFGSGVTQAAGRRGTRNAARTVVQAGGEAAAKGGKNLLGKVLKTVFSVGPLKKFAHIAPKLSTRIAKEGGEKLVKQGATKLTAKLAGGPAVLAAAIAADFALGVNNAPNYFKAAPGAVTTAKQRIVSGAAEAISGFTFGLIPPDFMLDMIYPFIATDEEKAVMAESKEIMTGLEEDYDVSGDGLNRLVNATAGTSFMNAFRTKDKEDKVNMQTLGIQEEDTEKYNKLVVETKDMEVTAKLSRGMKLSKYLKLRKKTSDRYGGENGIKITDRHVELAKILEDASRTKDVWKDTIETYEWDETASVTNNLATIEGRYKSNLAERGIKEKVTIGDKIDDATRETRFKVNALTKIYTDRRDALRDEIDNGINKAFNFITDKIKGGLKWAKDKILGGWNFVKEKVGKIWGGIKTWVANGIKGIGEKITGIWNGITGFVDKGVDFVVDKAKESWTGITGGIGSGIAFVGDKVTASLDFLRDKFPVPMGIIENMRDTIQEKRDAIMKSIKDGIVGGLTSAWNGIKGLAGRIKDTVTTEYTDNLNESWDEYNTNKDAPIIAFDPNEPGTAPPTPVLAEESAVESRGYSALDTRLPSSIMEEEPIPMASNVTSINDYADYRTTIEDDNTDSSTTATILPFNRTETDYDVSSIDYSQESSNIESRISEQNRGRDEVSEIQAARDQRVRDNSSNASDVAPIAPDVVATALPAIVGALAQLVDLNMKLIEAVTNQNNSSSNTTVNRYSSNSNTSVQSPVTNADTREYNNLKALGDRMASGE